MFAKNKRWSETEDIFLKENRMAMTYKEIATKLGRPLGGVENRVRLLGLRKHEHGHKWTKDEVDYLHKNYATMKCKELASKLGLSYTQTQAKVMALNLRKGITEAQRRTILSLLGTTTFSYGMIAKQIGRSEGAVSRFAREQGIKRGHRQSQYNLLNGFHHTGNKVSLDRARLLYAYRNTCYDCKKTYLSGPDLQIHHDFTRIPVMTVILCKSCHKKRHERG